MPAWPLHLCVVRYQAGAEALGNPVLNTSAQLEGADESVRSVYDAEECFGKQVDVIIDAGEIIPEPSTVISLLDDPPQVLRQGKGDSSLFAPFG